MGDVAIERYARGMCSFIADQLTLDFDSQCQVILRRVGRHAINQLETTPDWMREYQALFSEDND